MSLLESWSRISSLAFEGESIYTEEDKSTGETITSPEPNRFKCWLADLQLNKARWECDETGRRWDWFPFISPIRYRVEYTPRVSRWIDGAAPFLVRGETQAFDGKTAVSEERFVRPERPERTRYFLDDYRDGKWLNLMTLGLRCLPPFLSISADRVIAEIDTQSVAANSGENSQTGQYSLKFPRYLLSAEVTWDAARHWFTKVESTRLGTPSALLDKLRKKENLSTDEASRLRTEREVIETTSYIVDEFDQSPQAGIYFPRKINYTCHWINKRYETWSWVFKNWNANVPVPNELFHLEIPANARVHDRRKPVS
jgi:hypothetical protein